VAGERVLIVEDNETNMKLFRDVLTAAGYRTLEATTGAEAFELAVEHEPDLVLMDIQLPDGDGIEALRRLRADGRTSSVAVLALTAQAMHGDRDRFLTAGFDGYLSKPVDVLDLIGTVRKQCDAPGRRAAYSPETAQR
jgi:two-component system cell cycle response regulator DivK